MPISYEERRANLLRLKDQLHPELRKLISDRNVKAALDLPLRAQKTLARAIAGGLRKQPAAIRLLIRDPDISEDRLLQLVRSASKPGPDDAVHEAQDLKCAESDNETGRGEAISILADHLLATGYVRNRVAAEALAEADFMAGVLGLVEAVVRVREPKGADSETVTLALCSLATDLIQQLSKHLNENKAHRMLVLHSELNWSRFTAAKEKQ